MREQHVGVLACVENDEYAVTYEDILGSALRLLYVYGCYENLSNIRISKIRSPRRSAAGRGH